MRRTLWGTGGGFKATGPPQGTADLAERPHSLERIRRRLHDPGTGSGDATLTEA